MPTTPVNTGEIIQAATINSLVTAGAWNSLESGSGTTPNAYKVKFDGTGTNGNAIASLTDGLIVTFGALATNSGPATLEVLKSGGTFGTRPLTKTGNLPLVGGDIRAGQMVVAMFNGAGNRFEMIGPGVPNLVSAHGVEVVTTNSLNLAVAGQYYTNAAWTSANWMTDAGFWAAGANANKIIIPSGLSGKYFVRAVVQFGVINTSCVIGLAVGANGSYTPWAYEQRTIPISAGANTIVSTSVVINLTAGQDLTFSLVQTAGSNTALVAAGTSMQAIMIGA